jgi:hypothetical protein
MESTIMTELFVLGGIWVRFLIAPKACDRSALLSEYLLDGKEVAV